jgi:hypothetical protein
VCAPYSSTHTRSQAYAPGTREHWHMCPQVRQCGLVCAPILEDRVPKITSPRPRPLGHVPSVTASSKTLQGVTAAASELPPPPAPPPAHCPQLPAAAGTRARPVRPPARRARKFSPFRRRRRWCQPDHLPTQEGALRRRRSRSPGRSDRAGAAPGRMGGAGAPRRPVQ